MEGITSTSLWLHLQWVDDNVLNHISNVINAKTLWQNLDELFGRKSGTNKMLLNQTTHASKVSR